MYCRFIFGMTDYSEFAKFQYLMFQVLKDEESRKDYDYMLDNPG